MLDKFNMSKCTPVSIPLSPGLTLSFDNCPTTNQKAKEMLNTPYCKALGLLMWLQVATQLDLLYTVNILSHFVHNPGKQHWSALKHTLVYVRGTIYYGLVYQGGGDLNPTGYVNLDYTGCKDTHYLSGMESRVVIS